jgi:hypothetical protein
MTVNANTTATATVTNFGTDTSCTTSLLSGRMSSGVKLVAEACYRRLTTPRGMLQGGQDEQNYGLDLVRLIGQVVTPSQAAALEGQIQSELLKDERIDSVTATVTSTVNGAVTSWNIQISAQTGEGPFTLEIGVSGVTVSLLGLDTGS